MVVDIITSSLFIGKYYSIIWACHILLIHLAVSKCLDCVYFSLALMNDAAMNIHV